MVGTLKEPSALASSHKDKLWHVFLGRFHKDTTIANITDHLEKNDIKVVRVTQLPATQDWQQGSAAFRVSVELSCREKIFDCEIWRSNILIRDWYFKARPVEVNSD